MLSFLTISYFYHPDFCILFILKLKQNPLMLCHQFYSKIQNISHGFTNPYCLVHIIYLPSFCCSYCCSSFFKWTTSQVFHTCCVLCLDHSCFLFLGLNASSLWSFPPLPPPPSPHTFCLVRLPCYKTLFISFIQLDINIIYNMCDFQIKVYFSHENI